VIEASIAPEIAGRIRLGLVTLDGLEVRGESPALVAEIAVEARRLRDRYAGVKSADVPGAADARALYKALGLDPTKVRPSNEALLRRVLKGEDLYRVNTLVDALNLSSVRHQLPFGLYDLAHVHPPVVLRRGTAGEAYEGIRKGPVHVEGRPVLTDALGPFGNPTSDSARTMITLATTAALVVVYAPSGFATARLTAVMDDTAATLMRSSGGALSESRIVA
jgi:DNA/RNA-binding domain of Phe-tRNA-synthetase-like protein